MGYVMGKREEELPLHIMEAFYGGSPNPNEMKLANRAMPFIKRNWKLLTAAGIIGLWRMKPLSLFSGRDDSYNTIEGLKHGGMAEKKRKQMTEFGSGWDPLRKLVSEALGHEAGVFRKFIKSEGFQQALSKGKVIKELSSGSFGTAYLMETNVRVGGKKFLGMTLGGKKHTLQYVKKFIHEESEKVDWKDLFHEVKTQYKLEDFNAPTVYGWKDKNIYMEMFHGEEARAVMRRGGRLPQQFITSLRHGLTEMHARNIAHTDLMRDVSKFESSGFRSPGDKPVGLGEYVPHNVIITKEGQAGIIDYGLAGKAGKPGISGKYKDLDKMKAFGLREFSTNAEFDMALVESLERHQGKLSERAMNVFEGEYARTDLASTSRATSIATTPVANKIRHNRMAVAQKLTNHNMFENARSAGRRNKSLHAASKPTLPIRG